MGKAKAVVVLASLERLGKGRKDGGRGNRFEEGTFIQLGGETLHSVVLILKISQ